MRNLTLVVALVAGFVLAVPQKAQAAIDFEVNVIVGPVKNSSGIATVAGAYFNGLPYPNNLDTHPLGYEFLADEVNSFDFIISDVNGSSPGGFASWRGSASASGAFANQEGNRLYLTGTRLISEEPISLSNVTVTITSAPNPILNLTVDYNDANNYNSASVVGRQWVGAPGGDDDIKINSGSANQLVNEIWFYLGPGNGVSALGAVGETNQEMLNNTRKWIERNIETITFEVSYDDGSGPELGERALMVIPVTPVPEPATLTLLGLGIAALCYRRA